MNVRICIKVVSILMISFLSIDKNQTAPAQVESNSDFKRKLYSEGVMFYGRGNEPFWSLDIMNDNSLNFNILDGITLNSPPVKPERAMDANVRLYRASVEAGEIEVTLSEQNCVDDMSGEEFRYNVRVRVKCSSEKEFRSLSGCGNFVPDFGLEGKWSLSKIGNEPIADSSYYGKIPFLEFNPSAMSIGGKAGCNTISGEYIQEGEYMKIGQLAMTMMGCPESMREMEIVKRLNSTIMYDIDGSSLVLSNPDGILLVYEKLSDPGNDIGEDFSERYWILNDIWVLESLGGEQVKSEDFMNGLPMFELNIREGNYSGKGACNRINGKVEATNETISFGPAMMTRMACPGDYEQRFLNGMYSANKWKVENNRLYLFENDNELIIMKKAD